MFKLVSSHQTVALYGYLGVASQPNEQLLTGFVSLKRRLSNPNKLNLQYLSCKETVLTYVDFHDTLSAVLGFKIL